MIGIHAIISLMKQDFGITPFNTTRPFLFGVVLSVSRLPYVLGVLGAFGVLVAFRFCLAR